MVWGEGVVGLDGTFWLGNKIFFVGDSGDNISSYWLRKDVKWERLGVVEEDAISNVMERE